MTHSRNGRSVPLSALAGTSPGAPKFKGLSIDWTACAGRGLCLDLLPELLEPDPWGFPRSRPEAAAGPGALTVVPNGLGAPAQRAVHLCPKLALRLND